MATFPGARQAFTNAIGTEKLSSPDHGLYHGTLQDTVVAIEDVLGTTAGTSVLKNFNAGDIPLRLNAGVVKSTVAGGTMSTMVFPSPTITGGTINNPTIGTPAITGGTLTNSTILNYIKGDTSGKIIQIGTTGTTASIGTGAGDAISGTFATAFSAAPIVVGLVNGVTGHGNIQISLNAISGSVITFNIYNNGTVACTAKVLYLAYGSI